MSNQNTSQGNAPDYTAMAQAFMQNWQQQMSGQMQNEAFIRAMLDAMQAMPNMPSMQGSPNAHGAQYERGDATAEPTSDGDAATAELAKRVAACEARIAFLESQLMGKK